MDLIGFFRELTSSGISDFFVGGVILLAVRYWLSELRRDISKEIDDKIGAAKTEVQQSHTELRQEIAAVRTESRQEFSATRTYTEQSHTELRQEIREARTYTEQLRKDMRQEFSATRTNSEQSHKEIMLHLIDVRERLANIEGRLGAPTPRMSAVSPPLEAPAEEPSAQS